ncbi:hypothetical protein Q4540_12260 [Pseudoalteromonas carrageenovora]|uniref:hypothetical protein n=1 Tax=Pseudoalteromonas carrageenovora TaxID=227 RepID=UPI0026E38B7F|nr:hypothetical protein [Pseudoalteromonas carrageenovora]MDO6636953.1 hypothetical protein [Pseudoalteromonas carrageenovora]MDO6649267.1 hypothetical protein [Pseudoalteromonas carrageenovora]
MKKIYCYASLLISFSFLFVALQSASYFIALLVFMIILLVSSKMYKFQVGKELKDSYRGLPIVKLMAFLFQDKNILTSQNYTSLRILMLSATLGLSMIITFYLYSGVIRHLFLITGCILFSIIFSKVFLGRYIKNSR